MDNTIDQLLAKYFADKVTPDEKEQVEAWRSSSVDNQRHFDHYQQLWNRAAQASFIDDQTLETALKATKSRLRLHTVNKLYWRIIRQVAAVLIISVGLAALYQTLDLSVSTVKEDTVAMQQVRAVAGGSTKLQLPDGSVAHLFSGSTLTFPVVFSSEHRSVKLVGEGFFEVTHKTDHPFIVKTHGLNIRVLGTSFNVRANQDEDYVETVLVEGSVMLEHEENGHVNVLKTLKPNQRSVYHYASNRLKVIDQPDVSVYTAWKEGRLIFDATPLAEVAHRLEEWYQIDIDIESETIKEYKITGEFSGEPLQEVLQLIRLTSPIEFKIEKNDKRMVKKVLLKEK
ncbi:MULTISPECIES: FecR family protein [unclassified Carboxylicivirga]|uniref:FecR family protein n=1 Tax=Carboxylicivirga TaxID=1628153 RepID=UPI003D32E7AD